MFDLLHVQAQPHSHTLSHSVQDSSETQGYFEHTELEMMVEAGMSTTQALVAATGGAAEAMGLDQDVGVLRPGRWADLLGVVWWSIRRALCLRPGTCPGNPVVR